MSLYFVFLRKPKDLTDRRNDPFWEFGSFGRTGCHKANLLHPRRTPLRDGDQLAFLQGGRGEIRVIGVTPSISVTGSTGLLEPEWSRSYRPMPYSNAPLLIDNLGKTAFPSALQLLHGTRRSTYCGAAGSRLRSKMTAVDAELTNEILQWFASTALSKIKVYPEAIQSKGESWHMHAMSQGWSTASSRRQEYQRLGRK